MVRLCRRWILLAAWCGMASNLDRASMNWIAQGRCRVRQRALRVMRPVREKKCRLRVFGGLAPALPERRVRIQRARL